MSRSIELRKRLLIAESEVNRVLLTREYQALSRDVGQVTHLAKQLSTVAAAAAAVTSAVVAYRRKSAPPKPPESIWKFLMMKMLRFGLPLLATYSFKKAQSNGSSHRMAGAGSAVSGAAGSGEAEQSSKRS